MPPPATRGRQHRGDGYNRTPNCVSPDSTRTFHLYTFFPHPVCHLCYDGVVHEHGGQAPGREETGWTLWQSSIR